MDTLRALFAPPGVVADLASPTSVDTLRALCDGGLPDAEMCDIDFDQPVPQAPVVIEALSRRVGWGVCGGVKLVCGP